MCEFEGDLTVIVACVGVSSVVEQQTHRVRTTGGASVHDSRPSLVVFEIHIRPMIDQYFYGLLVAIARYPHQHGFAKCVCSVNLRSGFKKDLEEARIEEM